MDKKKGKGVLIYSFVFDDTDIDSVWNDVVEKASKSTSVQGFKKGSVPVDIIESRFGDKILNIVVDKMKDRAMSEMFQDFEDIDKIANISEPVPIAEYSRTNIAMQFEVQLHPEAPEVNFSSIKIKPIECNADDEYIMEQIKNAMSHNAELEEIKENRPLAIGDFANIDFQGYMNDKEIPSTKGTNYDLEIGSKSFIDNFEDQLINMNIGENRDINVTFPKEYHAKDLAGAKVKFNVILNAIKEKVDTELNDEAVKKFGFESLEKMKEIFRNSIESQLTLQVKSANKAMIDAVLRSKYCNFDTPAVFTNNEYQRLLKLMTDRNNVAKESDKKSEKEIVKLVQERSKINVCMSYIYRNVISKHNIDSGITDADIDAEIQQQAMFEGISLDMAMKKYKEDDKGSYMRAKIQEDRAFEIIFNAVNKTPVKVEPSKLQETLSKVYQDLE